MLLELVQLVCVTVLFIITIIQRRSLKHKSREIFELNSEIDRLNLQICNYEIQATKDLLSINKDILNIAYKIKRNYDISKTDKLHLIEFIVVLMNNLDSKLIYKVNVSNKYTFNKAADIIIDFIKNSKHNESQIKELLNSIFFLITK